MLSPKDAPNFAANAPVSPHAQDDPVVEIAKKIMPIPQKRECFAMDEIGLVIIQEDFTEEEYFEYAHVAAGVRSTSQWVVGDFFRAGEFRFGEKYLQAQAIFDVSPDTAKNHVWVSGVYPRHLRVKGLHWSHHVAVARKEIPMNAKQEMLRLALESNPHWSSDDLKDYAEKHYPPEGGSSWQQCHSLNFEGTAEELLAFYRRILPDFDKNATLRINVKQKAGNK